MRVRMIHGIHSPEGSNNMQGFSPFIRAAMPGAQVDVYEYGFMGFWAARWENEGVARRFAALSRERRHLHRTEVWITHSNGAAIAYRAVTDFGADPDMIININPALDRWRAAPVPIIEIAHSNNDRWVNLAQWLPGHIWGDQGRNGFGPTALRAAEIHPGAEVLNHNASAISGAMAYDDHCGMFSGDQRRRDWARFWAGRVEEQLR